MNADLKLSLFESKKEVLLFLLAIMIVFLANLFLQHQTYKKLSNEKFFRTNATIINQYQKTSKKGKVYHVLKLKSVDGYTFITTNYEDIKDLRDREVRIGLITDKVTFLDFLKSFYAPSFDIELLDYHDKPREILQEKIQTVENNITRFVAFVKKQNIPKNHKQEKTSLSFSTNHTPGALMSLLKIFSDHQMNLTKLESRPIPTDPFHYTFFIDFIGSLDDAKVQDCMQEAKSAVNNIRILGSYPLAN